MSFLWTRISSQSLERIIDMVMLSPTTARDFWHRSSASAGEVKKELVALRARGFTKVRVDGQQRSLDYDPQLDRGAPHDHVCSIACP